MQIGLGNIIAGIAAGIALLSLLLKYGYTNWKTSKLNKKADLGANFIKIGSTNYRLKIFNKGKAAARNVRIEFPEGNDVLIQSDIDEKFPLESLDTFQAVELIADVHLGTKRKHTILLIWSDGFSKNNEKTLYPTI